MDKSSTLQPGATLQCGKYQIIRILGQGGFGITYEAKHILLKSTVAIKEFFMKDCCERDESTSNVTVGTGSQRQLVDKFRGKFVREAQMIHAMYHTNIVRVTDVFEENGTAYYVMDYLPGGSLADKVKKEGPLSEVEAEKYIRQVADSLDYIHSQHTVHLDVKPSNILLDAKGDAVLIDFGISKHYDDAGEQTSSTPVGISKGYAPLEQGRDGDVSQFKPSTDIYALGATLYYLVSGNVPSEASIVNEDGLDRPANISNRIWKAIETAMQPRRKDRPQNVAAFLKLLDENAEKANSETTVIVSKTTSNNPAPKTEPKLVEEKLKKWLGPLLAGAAIIAIIVALIIGGKGNRGDNEVLLSPVDSTAVNTAVGQGNPDKPEVNADNETFGSVKVSSSPAGATIWLDGKNTKKVTPEILEDLSAGKHSVKLVMEGYEEVLVSVTITSDKRAELSKTLTANNNFIQQQTLSSGQSGTIPSTSDNTEWAGSTTSNSINGHEWVDLGLSVKWATCNVGSSSPSDYGGYYAWGETSAKSNYSWKTLKYCMDSEGNLFSQYVPSDRRGSWGGSSSPDNMTRLTLSDDAARVNWGGTWRMPTDSEWTELRMKCKWTWTSQGGKNGYMVIGSNGNSIFLPAAGSKDATYLDNAGTYGYYWSSSLCKDFPFEAWSVCFFSKEVSRYEHGLRALGFSIRPVSE